MSFWKSERVAKASSDQADRIGSKIDVNYTHERVISPLNKLAEMTNTLMKSNKPELARAGNVLLECIAQVHQAIQSQAIRSELEEGPKFKL